MVRQRSGAKDEGQMGEYIIGVVLTVSSMVVNWWWMSIWPWKWWWWMVGDRM